MGITVWMRDHEQRHSLGPLPPGVTLRLIPRDAPPPAQIHEAEFLVPPYDSRPVLELIARMPKLAVVQAISAGVEWLLPWVPEGVTVCNARGTRDAAVAEWVLASVLAMERQLPVLMSQQADRLWSHRLGAEIAGKRALVVGYGSVGRCVADRLTALGVHVEGVASRAHAGVHAVEELPDLLGSADIVVLAMPLTPSTHHLFDNRMLARMRPGSLLVNAARGAVVDTAALLKHLVEEQIRAVLDVTDPEPLPPESPLWDAPGLLLTPHLAGDTAQSEQRVYRLVGEQIRRYANREPLSNVVLSG